MSRLTPAEAAQKQVTRGSAAVKDYKDGVARVTEAPGAKAAKKQDKALAGFQEAVTSGRWARRVSAVSLEDWKKAATDKGANRIATGLTAAQGKLEKVYAEMFPFQDNLQNTIRNMPDAGLEDSIQRSAAWIRGMAEFKKRR